MMEIFTQRDRAVSPVIGVILMVAITVILAAVIGAFVLGIGPDQDPAPQGTYQLADGEGTDEIKFRHRGGDDVDFTEINVVVQDGSGLDDTESPYEHDSGSAAAGVYTTDNDVVSAGQDETLTFDSGDTSAGDTVTVALVHQPSDSIIREDTVEVGS